jgi:hypothetical protein
LNQGDCWQVLLEMVAPRQKGPSTVLLTPPRNLSLKLRPANQPFLIPANRGPFHAALTLNQRVPGSSPGAPTKQIKHLSLIFRASGLRFRSGATFGATSIIFFFEAGRGTGETVLSRLKQGFDSPRDILRILALAALLAGRRSGAVKPYAPSGCYHGWVVEQLKMADIFSGGSGSQ